MNIQELLWNIYKTNSDERLRQYRESRRNNVQKYEKLVVDSIEGNLEKYKSLAMDGHRSATVYKTKGSSECSFLEDAIINLTGCAYSGTYKGLGVTYNKKSGYIFTKCSVDISWDSEDDDDLCCNPYYEDI